VSETVKEINLKITSVALVLVSVMATLGSTAAFAQNPLYGTYVGPSKISRNIMRAETKRGVEQVGRYGSDNAFAQKFALPPLPGDQSFADSVSEAKKFFEEGGVMPDYGANVRQNVNITLPPLTGLRQILNSPVTKNLLKDLTSAEATVLMQTYMMVENGAATGFMGGMNIGSNLMSNMLQAQDFQFKLLEATDDTGKMKEAYINKIAKMMQTGGSKDIWPAALYIASGENGQSSGVQVMSNLNDGFKPYDLEFIRGDGTTGDSPTKRTLTDMLFNSQVAPPPPPGSAAPPPDSPNSKYSNEQIDKVRQDFIDLLGDVEINLDISKAKLARDVTISFKAPKMDKDQNGRRGVARLNWEEVQVVWQNINLLLYQYCDWMESGVNKDRQVFQMETSTTTNRMGGDSDGLGNPWELASAPDITFTMNVLDQIMKKHLEYRPVGNLICSELRLEPSGIPEEGAAPSDGNNNMNDCGPKKGCLKNRIVLHISYMIARSRTLHTYRALYGIANRFVTEPVAGELLNRLFNRAFSGMDLDAELEANRARYNEFVNHMSALTQGELGAGPVLRPGQNDVVRN
jgi:hypothetical protein